MKTSNFISFEQIELKNGFWLVRYDVNKRVSIENVRKRFEETGRFDALRFNYLKNGRRPHVFFDSDVAKWIEAVSYIYAKDPESMRDNMALCDELISCMEAAQRPDGYLNSAHQQLFPENIFRLRNNHELYCAGHLIEAAIAYQRATGSDRFLRIMERYCDCIYRAFISEKTAAFTTPGHEEIELALIKLYRHTGCEKYFEMARFFLANRAVAANEKYPPDGNPREHQDDADIYHLREANGHCVRALYYYCGIADLAAETGDERLIDNLQAVFSDITGKKMYLTGGVGSTHRGEGFTVGYDLPNFTAYNESCAAIAMIMFARRMRMIDRSARYGHVAERVLYNAFMSSTSLDGKSFFYENPLELSLEDYGRECAVSESKREHLPIKQRVEVFSCSCCPPNINRFIGELGDFICLEEDGHVCVEQYISADISTSFGMLTIDERYAADGHATICSDDYTAGILAIRSPEWCRTFGAVLNGKTVEPEIREGYAYFEVGTAFRLELDFHPEPVFVAANPRVRADAGRVALTYGPLVMCIEGVDNDARLNQISVDIKDISRASLTLDDTPCAMPVITLPAYRDNDHDGLYFAADESGSHTISLKFIPYFAFANRGESDMLVWVRRRY